jgi:hypothetical protein
VNGDSKDKEEEEEEEEKKRIRQIKTIDLERQHESSSCRK